MFKIFIAFILVFTSLVAQLNLKNNDTQLEMFMKAFPSHSTSILIPLLKVMIFSGTSLFLNWWFYRYVNFLEMITIQASYLVVAAFVSQAYLHEEMSSIKLFLGLITLTLTIIFTLI